MYYAVGYVLFVVFLQQNLRYSQHRGARDLSVVAVNYVVAAVVTGGFLLCAHNAGKVSAPRLALILGAINGVLYAVHLLALMSAIRLAGVGIAVALLCAGTVFLPSLVAWLRWGENMTAPRLVAIVFVPVASYLLRPRGDRTKPLTLKSEAVLAFISLGAGVISTIHKATDVYLPKDALITYQTVLFATAFLTAVAGLFLLKQGVRPGEVVYGVLIGAPNALATRCILLAIGVLGVVVVYPVTSSATIVGNVVIAWLFWKERHAPRQIVGIALAVAAVVLINF